MEDGQTVGRRNFLTLLGLAPTAPLLTHITRGDIAANVGIDIRDHGDISSGTITFALQATINAIGASGKCKTIMIPQVSNLDYLTQGAITFPSLSTGQTPWTLIYAAKHVYFTSTLSLPTSTTLTGGFVGGKLSIGGTGAIPPSGCTIAAQGAGMLDQPLILIDTAVRNILIQGLRFDSYGPAIKIKEASGVIIRDCEIDGPQGARSVPGPGNCA